MRCRSPDNPWPIDLLIHDAANRGNLRTDALFPFPTTVHLDDRLAFDIWWSDTANFNLAMNVLRYSCFVRAVVRGYARPSIETSRTFRAAEPQLEHSLQIRKVFALVEGHLW